MDLAASDGEVERAARIGVDVLEFANAIRRGGLIVDFCISNSIASIGLERLRKLRHLLEGPQCAALISDLQRIDREQEPLAEILERDRRWEAAVDTPHDPGVSPEELPYDPSSGISEEQHHAIGAALQSMMQLPENEIHGLHQEHDRRDTAWLRMLSIDLSVRSCRMATGTFPRVLAELAPAFFPSVPLDPFTEEPFRYHADNGKFLLYSPGPSRIDHDGVFGPWSAVSFGQADLCLDAGDFDSFVVPPASSSGLVGRIISRLHAAFSE
jgi:hypothetical protein